MQRGGIADVTYVADWDAKGRSNDEEETMRSQWTDKATGKVINLSNYAYSQMSGWNGYPIVSFNDLTSWVAEHISESTIKLTRPSSTVGWLLQIPKESILNVAFKLRVSTSTGQNISLFYVDDTNSVIKSMPLNNGLNDIPAYGDLDFTFAVIQANTLDVGGVITLEQLPLYPGALVSDGVDDYISEDGTLGEAVGTVLIHWKDIGLPNGHYLYTTSLEDTGRLYCYRYLNGPEIAAGLPNMEMTGEPIMCFTREPAVPQGPLSNRNRVNNCPIFRLIFIKEKLDDAQQEFLMWKVSKEYRDWCKENGYEYAITEMLNN